MYGSRSSKTGREKMNLFLVEIWNGGHWVPIPETATLEEKIAIHTLHDRQLTHPHIKYRVRRYVRVGRW